MSIEQIQLERSKLNKILANKKILEVKLKVKLTDDKHSLLVEGEEVDIYTATKVIEAVERNFSVQLALLLTNQNYLLEDIQIKSITKKTNLESVRARIIGTEGKTIQTLETLSDCYIRLNDNVVSVLGEYDRMKDILHALKGLIAGSKQANVYKFLEKARTKIRAEDLGIKKE